MLHKMCYRLALNLGSTSLGWAMIRLDADHQPCAVIKAGVRIFSDGRNPKDGSSLAVTRREARTMRRRRDRLLKRNHPIFIENNNRLKALYGQRFYHALKRDVEHQRLFLEMVFVDQKVNNY